MLFDEVVLFEDRDDLNLAMKVSSDFLRADVNFLLVHLDTDHHFMPQHIFEDAKKMMIPDLIPGLYRIVIFMQNVDMPRNTIFQPALFSLNFRLFSFIERDATVMYPVRSPDGEELELVDEIHLRMPYSSLEKYECYGMGRRLPDNLTSGVLVQETDFAFSFAIFGGDMAFINDHVVKYQPEAGDDMLRIQIDAGVHAKLYLAKDFERDRESAQPLAISHDKLGNGVHEMVASGLSPKQTYIIDVLFASSPEDFEAKSLTECLIATMQVKIASSKSEYVCRRQGIKELRQKLEK